MLLLAKKSRIKTKSVFSLRLAHDFFTLLSPMCEVFTICFNTRCHMVTPLLNCTFMVVWRRILSNKQSSTLYIYQSGMVWYSRV